MRGDLHLQLPLCVSRTQRQRDARVVRAAHGQPGNVGCSRRVARTVADLQGHARIEAQDMAEALQYRPAW